MAENKTSLPEGVTEAEIRLSLKQAIYERLKKHLPPITIKDTIAILRDAVSEVSKKYGIDLNRIIDEY